MNDIAAYIDENKAFIADDRCATRSAPELWLVGLQASCYAEYDTGFHTDGRCGTNNDSGAGEPDKRT